MNTVCHETLREKVAAGIRAKILRQELLPGMRIVEQTLVDEFGVSRAPIREALRQLEQEGLVEYIRNAGCSVRRISLEDLYEIYLLRSNQEMLAVRHGGPFTEEELAAMDAVLAEMKQLTTGDLSAMMQLDQCFHEIIIKKPKMPRLYKTWAELSYGNIVAGLYDSVSLTSRALRLYAGHQLLADVCRSGDTEAICAALKDHYMLPIKQMMEKNGLDADSYKF